MAFHLPTLDFVKRRKRSYRVVLHHDTIEHRDVMGDLAKYCRAFDTAYIPGDPEATLVALGRQQVWQRIRAHLDRSDEELYKLYGGPNLDERKTNG